LRWFDVTQQIAERQGKKARLMGEWEKETSPSTRGAVVVNYILVAATGPTGQRFKVKDH
jgi:hypothetical protein